MLIDQTKPGQASQHEKMDQEQKVEHFLGCLYGLSENDEISVMGLKKGRRHVLQHFQKLSEGFARFILRENGVSQKDLRNDI